MFSNTAKPISFNNLSSQSLGRSSSTSLQALSRKVPSSSDIVSNFGSLRRSSNASVISDKESLYYKFNLKRVTKVRLDLENRLDSDFFAGFLADRSLFAQFLNSNGEKIGRATDSVKPEDELGYVTRRLNPGVYYLQLKSNYSGDVKYKIQLRTTAND